jgi:hypothetical protein
MAAIHGVRLVRKFTIPEIADFVERDPTTVRKWFESMIGVLKYPRGEGNQKPTLLIPEPIVRTKLLGIGYSPEEIETGLMEPHDRRIAQPEPKLELAIPAKRGRPRKNARKRVAS